MNEKNNRDLGPMTMMDLIAGTRGDPIPHYLNETPQTYDATEEEPIYTAPKTTQFIQFTIPSAQLSYSIDDSEEIRTVDPDTGAEKGTKLARYDLIPQGALRELAEHYGRGAKKYADHNWRRKYDWSKSYAALCRHLQQFWDGEDYDEETGSKHIIAVAWHAFVLATYMDENREKDDRWSTLIEQEDDK